MSDLGKAYVQIVPSAKGISGSITNVLNGEASSAGEYAGNTIASKMKSILLKAGIGTAILKGIKESLSEGAALEQSLGGVETLFKDNADTVKEYAKSAFKEAGVSANTYMEQVTSFSASLINSLNGDTAKAAEYANTAMNDMADNANKFGTSMEDIQHAYQGFAKQNYTMLDNLKLGYGGTKTEMERLLADAQAISGVEYDVSSYADIVEAIHIIQEEMGVTGTTAKEAASTFSGSFGSMKAAAQDFLGTLATFGSDSELFDLQESMQNLISSFNTFFFNNFIPMIGRIIANLPVAIGQFLYDNIDSMTENGVAMMDSMADGLEEGIPNLVAKAMPMILELSEKIRENAGKLIAAAAHLIVSLGKGLIQSLPTLIEYVPQIVTNIASIIAENIPTIIAAAWDLIKALAQGLLEAVPALITNIGSICESMATVFLGYDWVNLGGKLINWVADGIWSLITAPVRAIQSVVESIKEVFNGSNWASIGKNIVKGIVNGLKNAAGSLISSIKDLASNALSTFTSVLGIGSPSRAFAEQAEWIPEGGSVGVERNMSSFINSINDMANEALNTSRVSLSPTQVATAVGRGSMTATTSTDLSILNQVVALLEDIKGKSSDVYLDGTKVTARVTQNITNNVNRLNKLKGAY